MLTLPTNDLRSEAKEYQRDRNHNAKWARGFAPASGTRCTHGDALARPCDLCAKRPKHRDADRRLGRHFSQLKHEAHKSTGQKATLARKLLRSDVLDATGGPLAHVSDSSGDEDVRDASAAPVPDADVMYSFDAASSPGQGTDILSYAVHQAVQRFENKETEKLAKEYDFADDAKDHADGYAADADEDGFEMIDHAHWE